MAENMDEISYSGNRRTLRQRLSKRVILFGTFFVIILILLLGVAYFATRGNTSSQAQKPTPAPTPQVSNAPTPSEEPSPSPIPKSTPRPTKTVEPDSGTSIKVAVQNGSGEAGVAASAAAVLRNAGYTVASTGNADNFDYTNVTIQVKNSRKSILSDLKSALSKDYTVGKTSSDLSEGQNYDALVIIGK